MIGPDLDAHLPRGASDSYDPYLRPPPLRSEADIMATWNAASGVVVTICCATYQHERFIADALRGFLGQVTTYPFKILVRDDASTDKTAEIVRDFANRYPRIVEAIFEKTNRWAEGVRPSSVFTRFAEGEFIATCEGDDYWFSPHKLQTQIDLLNANPSVNVVATKCFELRDGEVSPHGIMPRVSPAGFTADAIMLDREWPMTQTRVTRRSWTQRYVADVPEAFRRDSTSVRYTVMKAPPSVTHPILLVDSCMSVYRKHAGGVHAGASALTVQSGILRYVPFQLGLCRNEKWRRQLWKELVYAALFVTLSPSTTVAQKASACRTVYTHSSWSQRVRFTYLLIRRFLAGLVHPFRRPG